MKCRGNLGSEGNFYREFLGVRLKMAVSCFSIDRENIGTLLNTDKISVISKDFMQQIARKYLTFALYLDCSL